VTKIKFRTEAFKRLESSAQFDESVSLVTPKMWIALLGMVLFVGFWVGWAFIDQIPEKVDAHGIFYYSGHISEITSKKAGVLLDVFVREGQAVVSGQLLASVEVQEQCNLNVQSVSQLEIRAPYAGMIMNISAYPISRVQEGEALFLLFPLGIAKRDLVGVAFVAAADGKKIREGMKTEFEVSSVGAEQYGKMLGKVSKVSQLPVGKEEIIALVKNSQLATAIQKEFPIAPFYVNLLPDLKKNSVTGYQWTLKEPTRQIDPGTVFKAKITVKRQRPIDYVIPIFQRIL
jgi:multidrug resistance efflux pump